MSLVAWAGRVGALGGAYLLDGRLADATRVAQDGLAGARQWGERGVEGDILRLLGDIAAHPDHLEVDTAEAHYHEALTLAEELGLRALGSRCHLGLGALEAGAANELANAFSVMVRARVSALLVLADGMFWGERTRIADLALRHRLPSVFGNTEFAKAGGLMTYSPDSVASYRRVGYYVDRILKGAKLGDLPVEQPTKFEFVINLKTAKALGLTIPQSLLQRADQVIE